MPLQITACVSVKQWPQAIHCVQLGVAKCRAHSTGYRVFFSDQKFRDEVFIDIVKEIAVLLSFKSTLTGDLAGSQ